MSVEVPCADFRFRLRDELAFLPGVVRGERVYTVEDPVSGKYFQVGSMEYALARQLDGATSLDQAWRRANESLGAEVFTRDKASTAVRWMIGAGLIHTRWGEGLISAPANGAAVRQRTWSAIFFRIRLLHPDAALAAITPWLGWIFSPIALAAALALAVIAVGALAVYGGEMAGSSKRLLSPDQGFQTFAIWLLLKTIHEIAHGVACKKYGGRVAEAGVAFLLFAPLPYVDVTSSWRFRSKWRRMLIAAAGMYVEIVAASAAIVAWSLLEPGVGRQMCVQIAALAILGTVVFNANPLMRFDGYYILADWLEEPNLYSESQRWLLGLAKKCLLAPSHRLPRLALRRKLLLIGYGAASALWRVVACVSIIVAAVYLFHGAGLALAAIAAVSWFACPLIRLAMYLARPPEGESLHRLRFFGLTAIGAGAGAVALFATPWPGGAGAPGVVEFDPLVYVRAPHAGFVRELRVADGGRVEAGSVIAVLEDELLDMEIAQLRLAVEQAEVQCRKLQHQGDLAAFQAEAARKHGMVTQLESLVTKKDSLIIRAPTSGVVLARGLDRQIGRHLESGDEVCLIAGAGRIVSSSIDQEQVEIFRRNLNQPVWVKLPGLAPLRGILTAIEPAASRTPPHRGLCAPYGGPLPVVRTGEQAAPDALEFLEPRFNARIALTDDVWAGRLCEVRLEDENETLRVRLLRVARNWQRRMAGDGA